MDILESKVDHVIELLTNTGSDSELEVCFFGLHLVDYRTLH